MSPDITPDNYPQYLIEYAYKVNESFPFEAMTECPYNFDTKNHDYADMQEMVWFTHARVNPRTGLTMLEEFLKKYVKDKKTAAKILQAKNLIHDKFEALENTDGIITVRAAKDGAVYRVKGGRSPGLFVRAGSRFLTIIHPWNKDGTYKFAGSLMLVDR